VRSVATLLLLAAGIAVMFLTSPLPQDPAYHEFADDRRLAGIANAANVLSNVPFLLVGAWGLAVISWTDAARDNILCWAVFFLGVLLTGLGSGWYHLSPDNQSLVWDRLAMAIAFTSFFAALLGEFFGVRLARRLLVPLMLAGIASVIWWVWSENRGHGDLRPYALVVIVPMAVIPALLLRKGRGHDLTDKLWLLVAFYVAAKLFEYFDKQIFAFGGAVSGHTLKHLAAAIAPALVVYGLYQRNRSARSPGHLAH